MQPAVRKTISERTLSGAAMEDLLPDLMDELHALDEALKAFKPLNRPPYNGYPQTRKRLNPGGGGGKEKPAAVPRA